MNQGAYDGLPDEQRAALDAIAGRTLSASAEEGWNARAQQVIEQIQATGDNTVYFLSEEEAAPFAELTVAVRDEVVGGIDGGAEVLATMQGM